MLWAVPGAVAGTLAGFLPGVHPNNFIPLFVLLPDPVSFVVPFYACYSISSSFQAIFLGAPGGENALAITPGHRLAAKGLGLQAFKKAATVSFLVILTSPFMLLIYAGLSAARSTLDVLVLVVLTLLLARMLAGRGALVTILAGALGLLCSDYNMLMPLLAGFFGASTLVFTFRKGRIPAQHQKEKPPRLRSVLASHFSAFLFALVPGASAGVASAFSRITGKRTDEDHVAVISGIGAAYTVFSVYTLYLYQVTRSGLASFLRPLDPLFLQVMGLLFFSAGTGLMLSFLAAEKITGVMSGLDSRTVSLFSLSFLVLLVLVFTGAFGLLVFFASTSIGILALVMRTERINCMSAIILPVWLRMIL